jgi:hypothetical protein
MAQALSNWARTMQLELDRWLQEPDPVIKAKLKRAWEQRLMENAKPARQRPGEQP